MAARRRKIAAFAKEPFRIFFPLATLAGMAGVALWPLHFANIVAWYPGQLHARIMAFGLFGGFILGFLGTAMPRMLSASPLQPIECGMIAMMYSAMVLLYLMGYATGGDGAWLAVITLFAIFMSRRLGQRKDMPPPGFIMVGLAFVCVAAGSIISIASAWRELDFAWLSLQKLLSYQGFILLPILGIGPFILPRFLGVKSPHELPEMLKPTPDWSQKALAAGFTGFVIIASFWIEADGHFRLAYSIRFVASALYGWFSMPWKSAPGIKNPLTLSIRIAFASLCAGFLAIAILPEQRVGLLHLTLIGGFAVMTFTVATRVVFGHSGNARLLQARNRWVPVSVGLMLFAMATRISGDFLPHIMASHYTYGAILWIISAGIWAAYVLPKVFVFDEE
jgi:uncharacterized protein involved in response to NO